MRWKLIKLKKLFSHKIKNIAEIRHYLCKKRFFDDSNYSQEYECIIQLEDHERDKKNEVTIFKQKEISS
jgi:hypothetical protein